GPQRGARISGGAIGVVAAGAAGTTSAWPSWISWAAGMMACRPEPQSRLTVSAGASSGMPDFRPMWRAKYTASPDVWRTLPKMTWSICFGSTLDFSSAPFAAMMPRSVAEVSRSAPPYVPKAVRAPSMMTLSFMDGSRAARPLPSIVPPGGRRADDASSVLRRSKRCEHRAKVFCRIWQREAHRVSGGSDHHGGRTARQPEAGSIRKTARRPTGERDRRGAVRVRRDERGARDVHVDPLASCVVRDERFERTGHDCRVISREDQDVFVVRQNV